MDSNVAKAICLIVTTIATTGCATMARQEARKVAVTQCQQDGKIFVEQTTATQGGLFGHVTVMGHCLGPDDPGYEEARHTVRPEPGPD
ncbi:MAG TPA: hypothetical protein VNS79_14935 [Sphingobium sp.]|nr:hypothetical protein [Sphingobium sp.]